MWYEPHPCAPVCCPARPPSLCSPNAWPGGKPLDLPLPLNPSLGGHKLSTPPGPERPAGSCPKASSIPHVPLTPQAGVWVECIAWEGLSAMNSYMAPSSHLQQNETNQLTHSLLPSHDTSLSLPADPKPVCSIPDLVYTATNDKCLVLTFIFVFDNAK